MDNLSSEPLSRFRLFETTDVDEVKAEVSRAFCPHKLCVKSNQKIHAVQNRVDAGGYTLNYLQYGAEVGIDVEQLGDFFLLQISLGGGGRFQRGDDTVDVSQETAILLSPKARFSIDWSTQSRHLILQIPGDAMRRGLEALLDRRVSKPLEFDLDFRFDGSRQRILKLIHLLRDDLQSGNGVMTTGIAGAQIREAIIMAIIKCQPHSYSDALASPQRGLAPWQVRRAEDFMRQNVGQPISLADIAAASGGSIRTLHEGFRRFRDVTPIQSLRSLRLEGTHKDLCSPRRDDTVTSIALRWGFSHLSRFSISYREKYTESPSATMRRGLAATREVPSH